MGSLTLRSFSLQPKINMKAFFVIFALVAAAYADADAEADPYLLYGGYNGYAGWGGYTGYAGLPYGAYGYAGYGLGASAHPYGLGAAVKNVEHIVEPVKVKAITAPVATYAAAPALPALAPYALAAGVCHNVAGLPVPCAHGAAHIIAKRDAEADPAYFYNGYHGYAGYGHAGYGYGLGAYGAYGAYGLGAYGAYGAYGLGLAAAPSDPTHPHLVHTSRFGVCVNYLGARVSC